jgi:methylated-DNA-[protein]-cysteine S-methyltransferase
MSATDSVKYAIFNTEVGWMGIVGSARGLLRTTLPQYSELEARKLLEIDNAVWSPQLFGDLIERFRAYFGGHEVIFPDRLDLSKATAFQRRIWEATRLIPYGSTSNYRWVAGQVGKVSAARAVGQALARNPLPIIVPCHRVITSRGKLGGYSGGVEMKKQLLGLEAARSNK